MNWTVFWLGIVAWFVGSFGFGLFIGAVLHRLNQQPPIPLYEDSWLKDLRERRYDRED